MLRCACVRIASVTRKPRRLSAILMQSVEMIEELPTKSARFFAQLCPNRLRLPEVEAPKQLPVQ
jgi:hypothetical protein